MKSILFVSILISLIFLFGCIENNLVIGGKDDNGCLVGAGYSWCPSTEKCQRMWETYCEEYKDIFKITDFNSCIKAGYPVMESYPRKCNDGNETFTEILEEWKNGTILMQNPETKEYGCFGCGEDNTGQAICIDPSSIMVQVEESKDFYCNKDFAIVQKIYSCSEKEKNAKACIELYDPVCANVQVDCITTPCEPIKETFSNSCFACMNDRVISYTKSKC